MLINTPISLGELVDKISILLVKKNRIKDQSKLDQVKKELDFLNNTIIKYVEMDAIESYLNALILINSKLWEIEDDIRNCEKNKKFGKNFIELARSVYITNDKRAELKFDINKKFGSELVEVKSYEKY